MDRRKFVKTAGVAGLAAAYRIREQGRERGLDLEVLVLEAGTQVGGKIGTLNEDGFVCD